MARARAELLVGDAALDADQQLLVEDGQDALEHRNGRDVITPLDQPLLRLFSGTAADRRRLDET